MTTNPVKIYEEHFNDIDGKDDLIRILKGNKTKQQWRKHCIRHLHNNFTYGMDIPRRKDGSKLGLRKRIELARAEGWFV